MLLKLYHRRLHDVLADEGAEEGTQGQGAVGPPPACGAFPTGLQLQRDCARRGAAIH